jgi:hypothetical protein
MKTKALALALSALLLAGLVYTLRNSFIGRPQSKEPLGQSASDKRSIPSAATTAQRKILYYQDPMHPWYKSDKPGIAPDCGMKLVPVYADQQAGPAGAPGVVHLSPGQQQLIGVTLATAEYRVLDQTVRTVGQVDIDETRVASVHPRVSGWVQKVFADSTFQHVMTGDPLLTIYSPDLLAAEQEYLLALKARRTLGESPIRDVEAGGQTLLDAAAVASRYRTLQPRKSRKSNIRAKRDGKSRFIPQLPVTCWSERFLPTSTSHPRPNFTRSRTTA